MMLKKTLSTLLSVAMLMGGSFQPGVILAQNDRVETAATEDLIADNGLTLEFFRPSVIPADNSETGKEAFNKLRNVLSVRLTTPISEGEENPYSFEIKSGKDTSDGEFSKIQTVYLSQKNSVTRKVHYAYFEVPQEVLKKVTDQYLTVKAIKNEGTEDSTEEIQSVELVKVFLKESEQVSIKKENLKTQEDKDHILGEESNLYILASKKNDYLFPPTLIDNPDGEQKEFVGWNSSSGKTTGVSYITNSKASEQTAYAVYGVRPVKKVVIVDSPEKDEQPKELDLGSFEFGSPITKTFYAKNVGNVDATEVYIGNDSALTLNYPENQSHKATVEGKARKSFKIDKPEGDEDNYLEFTLTPSAKLPVGTHRYTFWFYAYGGPCATVTFKVTITNTKLTLDIPNIKKPYGKTLSSQSFNNENVKVLKGNSECGLKFSDLNVTLDSTGFTSTANAGQKYPLSVTSKNNDYDIDITHDETKGSIEVEKATPLTQSASASGIKVNTPFSESKLSVECYNQDSGVRVEGNFKWKDNEEPKSSSQPGTFKRTWVFEPAGTDLNNYVSTEGQVDVVVSNLEKTELKASPDAVKTFIYNGEPHTYSFEALRGENVINKGISYQYKLSSEGDSAYSDKQPVKAGTYNIKAVIESDGTYAPADAVDTLIIEPKPLVISYSASSKNYDGTDKAYPNVSWNSSLVGTDSVTVKYEARFINYNAGNNREVEIRFTGLEGTEKENYKIEQEVVHTTANIKPLTLTFKPGTNVLKKEFGATLQLQDSDFTIEGFAPGETLENTNTNVEYSSQGCLSETEVGKYPLTIQIANENYTCGTNSLNVEVTPSEPFVKADPQAGLGKVKNDLSTVPLYAGEVVNKHNNNLIVKGSWAWTDTSKTLQDTEGTDNKQCTFTVADTKNYVSTPINKTIPIQVVDKEIVKITVKSPLAITYDGKEHNLDLEFEPSQVNYTITYNGSPDLPKNTGKYQVEVTAEPAIGLDKDYQTTREVFDFEILQAAAQINKETIEGIEGTRIGDLTKDISFSCNGETVLGEFDIDNPDDLITDESAYYNWNFVPNEDFSNNYSSVSGRLNVKMIDDTRTLKADVYNLPNADGYKDFAVLKLDGLRAGDIVAFYKEAGCSDLVSEERTITADDLDKAKNPKQSIEIPLDDDALDGSTNSIYARIIGKKSSKTIKAFSYEVERNVSISPDPVRLHKNKSVNAIAQFSQDSYKNGATYAWTTDVPTDSLLLENPDAQTAKLTGKVIYENGTLTLKVSLPYPGGITTDKTIDLERTVPVNITDLYSVEPDKDKESAVALITTSVSEQYEDGAIEVTVIPKEGEQVTRLDIYEKTLNGEKGKKLGSVDSSNTCTGDIKSAVAKVSTFGLNSSNLIALASTSHTFTFLMPDSDIIVEPITESISNPSQGGNNPGTPGGGSGTGGQGIGGSGTTGDSGDSKDKDDKPKDDPDVKDPEKDPDEIVDQNTTTDPEGNRTITTEYKDGTVEEKIEKVDGSTETTTARTDGSVEKVEESADKNTVVTTNKEPDGSLSVVTENKTADGKSTINGSVALSEKSISDAKSSGKNVTIRMPEIPADHTGDDVQLTVSIPESVESATLEIPVASETIEPGSVAMIENEKGELVPIVNSIGKDGKLIVPLSKSQKIIIKDNKLNFADVTTSTKDYPANGIAFLSARRLMTGVGDGTNFDLTGKVTRAQLATILYRYNGSPDTSGLSLPEGADPAGYYASAAKWAVANKLMAVGSNFNAGGLLTREQLAMILWRMEGNPNPGAMNFSAYQDANSISSPEMQKAVGWAVNTGLMGKGTPKLNASGSSQRQELAAMLSRYLMK